MQRLPARYVALLSELAERRGGRRAWLGDAGFRLPSGAMDPGAWFASLAEARWMGMHPDLVPFAEDGFGNQFCFVHSASERMRGVRAIVYWMYETYRAVPIASSFDHFLEWIALTAQVAARKGDPVVDEHHVATEVLPLFAELGLPVDLDRALDGSDLDQMAVHRAFLRLDPEAPGSRVARAQRLMEQDRSLEALDLCAEACFAFPDFAGARAVASRILQHENDHRYFEALLQSLMRPLVYSGDPGMPFFRDLHVVDPTWAAEMLANHPDLGALAADEPIWTLIMRDDPMAAASWVQVALDYAQEDAIETAITLATNALFLGFGGELGREIHGLLGELYDVAGWDWHAQMVRRWAPP